MVFSMAKLESVLNGLSSSRTTLPPYRGAFLGLEFVGALCENEFHSTNGVLRTEGFPDCPFLKQCRVTM